jgi:hypothetical protein
MTFVYPLFLWALAAISIPVIIHLFNFRKYKKVYFTNVKFLKELRQESKSKSRLKEILVLLVRCLAIACLVLAFSQPVIYGDNEHAPAGNQVVSLYIDNSFSMQNVNRQGPLLDIAKTRAREVINAYGNGDKFHLITNDFEGRHQRFHTREDALALLEEIRISSAVRLYTDVLRRQTEFLSSSTATGKKIYAFSDGQRTTFNLKDLEPDTNTAITVVPLSANKINNVYLDTCWFEAPLQQKGFIQKLHARVANNGNANIEAGSAKLYLNNKQTAIASFSLAPNGNTTLHFTFECREAGFNYGSVKIEDYPVTFDDVMFFAFNSEVNIAVALVNGKNADGALHALFKNDSLYSLAEFAEQTIDYSAFAKSDVIVLNQLDELSSGLVSEIQKFTRQGGAVVVIPSPLTAMQYSAALSMLSVPYYTWRDSVPVRTGKIDLASGFYKGVFEKADERMNLPQVAMHYRLSKQRSDYEPVLTLQNGDIFLGFNKVNNALIYFFTAPLDPAFTNFSRHALFVPTFYQVCFSSMKAPPLFYEVSSNVVIGVKNDPGLQDQPPHIIGIENKDDIIPETRMINNSLLLNTRNQVNLPGFYKISRAKADLLPLAFNYSRRESNLACYSVHDLAEIIDEQGWQNVSLIADAQENISKQVALGAEGKKLWKLFIILALTFLMTEVALLRFLK